VITGRGVTAYQIPEEEELTGAVRSYQRAIEIEKTDPLRMGTSLPQRLFATLIAPVAADIANSRAIVVIPDGPLHRLNFETLVMASPKPHYWLEDVTLSVAPSLDLLASPQSRQQKRATSLLLVGDPLFADPAYPPLPYAGMEMQNARRTFPPEETTVLTKSTAVPSAFSAAHPERFAIIHIAAHAEANVRSPLDSAIVLSREPDGYRLYARDLMSQHLTASLVTLSACSSAGARTLSGEGPMGFAWALFQAGAQNVVASLWDVNDRSTATLMGHFYSAVNGGMTYAEALRQAKVEMMRTTPRPYYWAPFQLYSRGE
jgi:CHAT domain-containing protein